MAAIKLKAVRFKYPVSGSGIGTETGIDTQSRKSTSLALDGGWVYCTVGTHDFMVPVSNVTMVVPEVMEIPERAKPGPKPKAA